MIQIQAVGLNSAVRTIRMGVEYDGRVQTGKKLQNVMHYTWLFVGG